MTSVKIACGVIMAELPEGAEDSPTDGTCVNSKLKRESLALDASRVITEYAEHGLALKTHVSDDIGDVLGGYIAAQREVCVTVLQSVMSSLLVSAFLYTRDSVANRFAFSSEARTFLIQPTLR